MFASASPLSTQQQLKRRGHGGRGRAVEEVEAQVAQPTAETAAVVRPSSKKRDREQEIEKLKSALAQRELVLEGKYLRLFLHESFEFY